MLKRFLQNEDGSTAIEYGLIAALICIATIGGITAVGSSQVLQMQNLANEL